MKCSAIKNFNISVVTIRIFFSLFRRRFVFKVKALAFDVNGIKRMGIDGVQSMLLIKMHSVTADTFRYLIHKALRRYIDFGSPFFFGFYAP